MVCGFSLEENRKSVVGDHGRRRMLDLFTVDEVPANTPREEGLRGRTPEEWLKGLTRRRSFQTSAGDDRHAEAAETRFA